MKLTVAPVSSSAGVTEQVPEKQKGFKIIGLVMSSGMECGATCAVEAS